MKQNAKSSIAPEESGEREENGGVVLVPVFVNGKEVLACVTLREARERGIIAIARRVEGLDLQRDELYDRMKREFCELLILEKIRERSPS